MFFKILTLRFIIPCQFVIWSALVLAKLRFLSIMIGIKVEHWAIWLEVEHVNLIENILLSIVLFTQFLELFLQKVCKNSKHLRQELYFKVSYFELS